MMIFPFADIQKSSVNYENNISIEIIRNKIVITSITRSTSKNLSKIRLD